jgi:hypothetical protein
MSLAFLVTSVVIVATPGTGAVYTLVACPGGRAHGYQPLRTLVLSARPAADSR